MTALVLPPPGAHTIATAHADASSVTVAGPPVSDPATQTTGAKGSVTVFQTRNLVDQMVHVSWTGFTPSTHGSFVVFGNSNGGNWNAVGYPVVVYECRGTDPKITDCYGGSTTDRPHGRIPAPGRAAGLHAPDFPPNVVAAVTAATAPAAPTSRCAPRPRARRSGCDATHPCSIVVEPNYGGDALGFDALITALRRHCTYHDGDTAPERRGHGSGVRDRGASGSRTASSAPGTSARSSRSPSRRSPRRARRARPTSPPRACRWSTAP